MTTTIIPGAPTAPAAARKQSRALIVSICATSLAAIAGVTTALVVTLGGPAASALPAHTVVHHAATAPHERTVAPAPTPARHTASNVPHGTTPAAAPSHTIQLLQTQLAQLNYYNGPVNGYLNRGTINAVEYLQRDAHLPQTGRLDARTQAALDRMLSTGNNQMGD